MQADKWVLSSCMQKAIRRGQIQTAQSAGAGLWLADKVGFWRRLHTTALEDCGIGDLAAVTECLSGYWQTSWRKDKDLEVGLHLIGVLCRAVKCRIADELYLLIERDNRYDGIRRTLSELSDDKLQAVIAGKEALTTKALALWFLAGTDKFPSERLAKRKGSKDAVIEVLNNLAAPNELKRLCSDIVYRTQWPLALFTPLIFAKVGQAERGIRTTQIPVQPYPASAIPAYGVDTYTRLGKGCIRKFMAEVKGLKKFSTDQVGMTIFYLEGMVTDKTLTSTFLDEIRMDSELAMMDSQGLCAPEYLGLKEFVQENLPVLDEIRLKEIARYNVDFKDGLI